MVKPVVADTTKVRIFKQITTLDSLLNAGVKLLLIPQRYEFSSKSQRTEVPFDFTFSCCWYHKGTNFQANHNLEKYGPSLAAVVADTTKVRIFKQITTANSSYCQGDELLLIPQRYEFSSKSQLILSISANSVGCCWYHKGTNFQANHNTMYAWISLARVVADTTKVRIFKQITTVSYLTPALIWLLLIPQRYEFSSKSQQSAASNAASTGCCWYHKGTNFQANHN